MPFVIARHDAAWLGGVRVEWFGFLVARPVGCSIRSSG